MDNNNPFLDMLRGDRKPEAVFVDKPVGHVHEYYLSGEIDEPSKYTEWFNHMRHAGQNDVIKIYINSCGGDLWTALQFMRVIKECKAAVVASVEGACMSAATIIFLCADQYEVTPHSTFMFHNYSGGTIGKGGEMIDQMKHERRWSAKLFEEIYEDFLTKDEIQAMLDNKDLWFSAEQCVARLNKRRKAKEKKARAKTKVAKV
jgi:ATP-dependent protease ClpP protease subunit